MLTMTGEQGERRSKIWKSQSERETGRRGNRKRKAWLRGDTEENAQCGSERRPRWQTVDRSQPERSDATLRMNIYRGATRAGARNYSSLVYSFHAVITIARCYSRAKKNPGGGTKRGGSKVSNKKAGLIKKHVNTSRSGLLYFRLHWISPRLSWIGLQKLGTFAVRKGNLFR